MFSFLLTSCTNCDNLEDALCSIDAVVAQYGKNAWQNNAFMTNKDMPYVKIKQLQYYKEILTTIRWNQDAFCPFDYPTIVSRVRALLAGEFRIARKMVTIPITTTTTTTSTSTTSTTSTTTSTSTSTTSTTSTSTTSTSSTTTTSTSSTSSTTSTTSTTTTTVTTLPITLVIYNRSTPGTGMTVLVTRYDNYPPNNQQNVPGAYPVAPGQNISVGIAEGFIPARFTILPSGGTFGSITITGTDGVKQCLNFSGSNIYQFSNVMAKGGNKTVWIDIWPVGTICPTTSTTTTTTTTNFPESYISIFNNTGTSLTVNSGLFNNQPITGITFPIVNGQTSLGIGAGPATANLSVVLSSSTLWGKVIIVDSTGQVFCVNGNGSGSSPGFSNVTVNRNAVTTVTIYPPGDTC